MQFAVFCPPFTGHLNPMFAVGRALAARGHRVAFVGIGDIANTAAAAGFTARAVGLQSHPPAALAALERRLARLKGLLGIGAVIRDVARMTEMLCREAPAVLERLQPDAIVADQLEAAGGLLAERAGLPHVSIANALMIDREPYVPPPFTAWAYARTTWARERNLGGYRVGDWLMGPVAQVISRWATAWGLPPRRRAEQCLAPLQVGQLSAALDFPREALPRGFAYAGPLRSALVDEPPWHVSDGLRGRLAFVSLGTLQGGRFELLARITQACRDAGLTAVVAHNGRLTDIQAAALPGAPIVERYLPQRRVIERCAIVVTHGGLNTVLDALAQGVPLLLVPLAMEQGATAQRVLRAGAGLVAGPAGRYRVGALRRQIVQVLEEPRFSACAAELATSLAAAGGAPRAAELIERHVHGH